MVLGILIGVQILIPSEKTMHIMTGLYAGDKVIDTLSKSDTVQKAEQLLNKKLDEMLESENANNSQ